MKWQAHSNSFPEDYGPVPPAREGVSGIQSLNSSTMYSIGLESKVNPDKQDKPTGFDCESLKNKI
jgi:hypothetical protein